MSSQNTPPGGENQGWSAPPQTHPQPAAPAPAQGGSPGWSAPPQGAYPPGSGGPPGVMPPGGMPPGGIPPQGGWTAPTGGPPTQGGSGCGGGCGKAVLAIMVLGMLAIGALVAIGVALDDNGEAELVSVVVEEESPGYNAHIDATLVFLEPPEVDDPADLTDIEIRVSSIALTEPLTFGWTYIAQKDDRPETNGSTAPPLGMESRITFAIDDHLRSEVTYEYSIDMTVELWWAGKKRDRQTVNILSLYPSRS